MPTLDVLRMQMRDADPVLRALDLELEQITFNPLEPMSIEAAIDQVVEVIDARMEDFKSNPILGPMVDELKAQYVEGIQAQAAHTA